MFSLRGIVLPMGVIELKALLVVLCTILERMLHQRPNLLIKRITTKYLHFTHGSRKQLFIFRSLCDNTVYRSSLMAAGAKTASSRRKTKETRSVICYNGAIVSVLNTLLHIFRMNPGRNHPPRTIFPPVYCYGIFRGSTTLFALCQDEHRVSADPTDHQDQRTTQTNVIIVHISRASQRERESGGVALPGEQGQPQSSHSILMGPQPHSGQNSLQVVISCHNN